MIAWLRFALMSRRPRRLRAGWRIFVQTILELSLFSFLYFIFFRNVSSTSQQASVFGQLILLAATTLSIFLARRGLDRRSFDSLGLEVNPWMLWDLLFGFGLAGLLIAGIYCVEVQIGWLTVTGYSWQRESLTTVISETLAGFLVLGICPSWQEELTRRGYWLQNLTEGLNLGWGIVFTAAISTVLPVIGTILNRSNPQVNYLSTTVIFFTGLWLIYAWFVTHQLWLPLGIHAGWKFFEGIVFGFPLNGQGKHYFHWIEQTVVGPPWLTGGELGPDAGLVSIVAIVLGSICVLGWSRWRKFWDIKAQTHQSSI